MSLYDNGGATPIGTAVVQADGTWTTSVTLSGDGTHSIVATDTDTVGNTGMSAPVVFTLDTVPPTVSIGNAGTLTNQASQTISGTVDVADIGTTVALYDNGGTTPIGTAVVQPGLDNTPVGFSSAEATFYEVENDWAPSQMIDGLFTGPPGPGTYGGINGWSVYNYATGVSEAADALLTLASPLPAGQYELTFTIYQNYYGNPGHLLGDFSLDYTTAASPTLSSLQTPVTIESASSLNGTTFSFLSPGELLANTSQNSIGTDTYTISAFVDSASPITGIFLDAIKNPALPSSGPGRFDNGNFVVSELTLDASSSGTWSTTVALSGDSTHSLVAKDTDAAGNTGVSDAVAFILDTVAPAAPASLADTSVVNGYVNKASNTGTQALTGSAEAGSTVTVYDGSTQLPGAALADGTGRWSYTLGGLADGSHSFTATATDAADNTSDFSSALAFTVDTVAPVTSIVDISQSGTKKSSVSAISGLSESLSTVTLYDGTEVLGTATADNAGHWAIAINNLSDVVHTFTATAIDPAGNLGAASQPVFFGSSKADNISGVISDVAGGDLIEGSGGADKLTGGPGTDIFLYHLNFGKDTIAGFDLANDVLAFDQNLFGSVADVVSHTADVKGNAVITYDGADTVTLLGITTAQIAGNIALLGQYTASFATSAGGSGVTPTYDPPPETLAQTLTQLQHA